MTRPTLDQVVCLYLESDVCVLWGIPYPMRPGQQPGDLVRAYRDQPIRSYGTLGSTIPDPRDRWLRLDQRDPATKAFLDSCGDYVPGHPEEWSVLTK